MCYHRRLHLWRGLWLRCGMPGKQSLTSNTTLYLFFRAYHCNPSTKTE